jgi:hypothetical protein
MMLLTRDDVRAVACPLCRATTGKPCLEHGEERGSNHSQRVIAAESFWSGRRSGFSAGRSRQKKQRWSPYRHRRN